MSNKKIRLGTGEQIRPIQPSISLRMITDPDENIISVGEEYTFTYLDGSTIRGTISSIDPQHFTVSLNPPYYENDEEKQGTRTIILVMLDKIEQDGHLIAKISRLGGKKTKKIRRLRKSRKTRQLRRSKRTRRSRRNRRPKN